MLLVCSFGLCETCCGLLQLISTFTGVNGPNKQYHCVPTNSSELGSRPITSQTKGQNLSTNVFIKTKRNLAQRDYTAIQCAPSLAVFNCRIKALLGSVNEVYHMSGCTGEAVQWHANASASIYVPFLIIEL